GLQQFHLREGRSELPERSARVLHRTDFSGEWDSSGAFSRAKCVTRTGLFRYGHDAAEVVWLSEASDLWRECPIRVSSGLLQHLQQNKSAGSGEFGQSVSGQHHQFRWGEQQSTIRGAASRALRT